MNKKLGIITINFNTEDLLEKLIKSVLEQTYSNWIMIIVNNSDSDTAIKELLNKYGEDRILLLSINKNVGYSKGNNAGFDYLYSSKLISADDLVLFTNEDIILENKFIFEEALKRIENTRSGFWGPKIINNDGSLMLPHVKKSNYIKCLLHFGNNGFVDKVFGVNKSIKGIDRPVKVFLLNGAFFICRVKDFIRVDKLDENTFIYYEEELLYRKVSDMDIETIYDPTLNVLHAHSASVKKSFTILRKKKFVYEGELYFLRNILKINKFLEYLFRIERKIEFFFFGLKDLLKKKVNIHG